MEKLCSMMITWTPKVCKIMVLMAIILGLGPFFYILLGFGKSGNRNVAKFPLSQVWNYLGHSPPPPHQEPQLLGISMKMATSVKTPNTRLFVLGALQK